MKENCTKNHCSNQYNSTLAIINDKEDIEKIIYLKYFACGELINNSSLWIDEYNKTYNGCFSLQENTYFTKSDCSETINPLIYEITVDKYFDSPFINDVNKVFIVSIVILIVIQYSCDSLFEMND